MPLNIVVSPDKNYIVGGANANIVTFSLENLGNDIILYGNEEYFWDFGEADQPKLTGQGPHTIFYRRFSGESGYTVNVLVKQILPPALAGTNGTAGQSVFYYTASTIVYVYEFDKEIFGPDYVELNSVYQNFFISSGLFGGTSGFSFPQEVTWRMDNVTVTGEASTSGDVYNLTLNTSSIDYFDEIRYYTLTAEVTHGTVTVELVKRINVTLGQQVFGTRLNIDVTPSLMFFNKEGDNLNFDYVEYEKGKKRWQGDLIFHENSDETFKTIGLYTFEKVAPIEYTNSALTLSKFQFFNEYGLDFLANNLGGFEIDNIEVVIYRTGFKSKWVYGAQFHTMFPKGTDLWFENVKILNKNTLDDVTDTVSDFNPTAILNDSTTWNNYTSYNLNQKVSYLGAIWISTSNGNLNIAPSTTSTVWDVYYYANETQRRRLWTVIDTRNDAILVITDTDNITWDDNFIYDTENKGTIHSSNMIRIWYPLDFSNNSDADFSVWNESVGKIESDIYDKRKITIVNSPTNSSVVTVNYQNDDDNNKHLRRFLRIDCLSSENLPAGHGFEITLNFKTNKVLIGTEPVTFIPRAANVEYNRKDLLIFQDFDNRDKTPALMLPGNVVVFEDDGTTINFTKQYTVVMRDTAFNVLDINESDRKGWTLTMLSVANIVADPPTIKISNKDYKTNVVTDYNVILTNNTTFKTLIDRFNNKLPLNYSMTDMANLIQLEINAQAKGVVTSWKVGDIFLVVNDSDGWRISDVTIITKQTQATVSSVKNDPYLGKLPSTALSAGTVGYIYHRTKTATIHIQIGYDLPTETAIWHTISENKIVVWVDYITTTPIIEFLEDYNSVIYLNDTKVSFRQVWQNSSLLNLVLFAGNPLPESLVPAVREEQYKMFQRFITSWQTTFDYYGLDLYQHDDEICVSRKYTSYDDPNTTTYDASNDYVDVSVKSIRFDSGTAGDVLGAEHLVNIPITQEIRVCYALEILETLTNEYNQSWGLREKKPSILWQRKIVIDDIDAQFGLAFNINGILYDITFDDIVTGLPNSSDTLVDIERTLKDFGLKRFATDQDTLTPDDDRDVGLKYYEQLESLGIIITLEKSDENSSFDYGNSTSITGDIGIGNMSTVVPYEGTLKTFIVENTVSLEYLAQDTANIIIIGSAGTSGTGGNSFIGNLNTANYIDFDVIPGTISMAYDDASTSGITKMITDDGFGNLIGDGFGTINYSTGAYNFIATFPLVNIYATYVFTSLLELHDNGLGVLIGNGSGTIDYVTGDYNFVTSKNAVTTETIKYSLDYTGYIPYDTMVITSKYPNNVIDFSVNGTNNGHKILHSEIVFNVIENVLAITINGTRYSATGGNIYTILQNWINEHSIRLFQLDIIVQLIEVPFYALRFSTLKTSTPLKYQIYVGRNAAVGEILYTIEDFRPSNLGIVLASNEVIDATGGFEFNRFATGMLMTIVGSKWPLNNQQYNILLVDPQRLVLSYQGPFWTESDIFGDVDNSWLTLYNFTWEEFESPNIDFSFEVQAYRIDEASTETSIQVQFFDLSQNVNPIRWVWDFGDGTMYTGTIEDRQIYLDAINSGTGNVGMDPMNPRHYYTKNGKYVVQLIILSSNGAIESSSEMIKLSVGGASTSGLDFSNNLELLTKEFLRFPREGYNDDAAISFKWKWLEGNQTDIFYYDFSGNQLEDAGIYTYVGKKPLITDVNDNVKVFLNLTANKELKYVSDESRQQTVFEELVYDLEKIDSETDITFEPEPMQVFIAHRSDFEGVQRRTIILEKIEDLSVEIKTAKIDVNNVQTNLPAEYYKNVVYLFPEINELRVERFDRNFIDLNIRPGHFLKITGVDNTNVFGQAPFLNNGIVLEVTQIGTNWIRFTTESVKALKTESSWKELKSYRSPYNLISTTFNITIAVQPVEIARLALAGQTEIEDDRLRIQVYNNGFNIKPQDAYIFKDYDVQEYGVDWIFMNSKRKELLKNFPQIYNYIGSYKAVINAINYFGYNDLIFNEYYRNVDQNSKKYGKLLKVEIPDIFNNQVEGFAVNDFILGTLPNKRYVKTNLFNLTYQITDFEGNSVLAYSLDEVIIKLQGLKGWLQNEVIPIGKRILDITGSTRNHHEISIHHDVKQVINFTHSDTLNVVNFKAEAYLQPIINNSELYNVHIEFFTEQKIPISYFELKILTFSTEEDYRKEPFNMKSVQIIKEFKTDLKSYNFAADINVDPFILIETTTTNGYGEIYKKRRTYSLQSLAFL